MVVPYWKRTLVIWPLGLTVPSSLAEEIATFVAGLVVTIGRPHSDGDGYLYPGPYCDGDLHTNSDTNGNNNCDSNTNGDSDSYAYTNHTPHAHSNSHVYAETDT
jgi:hypothetical protein